MTTGSNNQIQNGCLIKENLIQPLIIPATLSLHCCDWRSLHLESGCLSYHFLQIEIRITAIINPQRQHLCRLVFSKRHFTEIAWVLMSAFVYFVFYFLSFLLLSFIFVFAYLSSFLLLLPSSFSFPLFYLLIPTLFPLPVLSASFLPPLSLLLVNSCLFSFTSPPRLSLSLFLCSCVNFSVPPILPWDQCPSDLNVPRAYSPTPF